MSVLSLHVKDVKSLVSSTSGVIYTHTRIGRSKFSVRKSGRGRGNNEIGGCGDYSMPTQSFQLRLLRSNIHPYLLQIYF
jgi:hypothetical protein